VSASSFYGDGSNLSGISAGFWTGSGDYISREGNVQITGSLRVSESGSFSYLDVTGDSIGAELVNANTGSFGQLLVSSTDNY
jgi:hypothetical protein